MAKPGDVIRIAPGEYTDCAIWRASRLTIEGTGAGAVLANKSCAGKGIFIIQGNDTTVRNLTFAHAAVPDHNGAGIRVEGRNLTVEHSRFIDNENGILAGVIANSTIRIIDSEFRGNGKCDPTLCPRHLRQCDRQAGRRTLAIRRPTRRPSYQIARTQHGIDRQ